MVNQQIGDLLEIQFEEKWYYLVVLTKRVVFGGNIVFAFHSGGERLARQQLLESRAGFNVCVDLLSAKKHGVVQRIHRFADVAPFFLTHFAKGTFPLGKGEKAHEWFIYRLDDLRTPILRVPRLAPEHVDAMDKGCFGFGLVADKILQKYTPAQNEHIQV